MSKYEPVWCLSFWEPIVSLSEWWHDRYPWRRLWSSYIVLPHGAWAKLLSKRDAPA